MVPLLQSILYHKQSISISWSYFELTLQGQFEIISLKGSYLLSDEGGSGNSNGGLSIMVSTPCGSLFGGSVGGPLIAADPVQVHDIILPLTKWNCRHMPQ